MATDNWVGKVQILDHSLKLPVVVASDPAPENQREVVRLPDLQRSGSLQLRNALRIARSDCWRMRLASQ